MKNPIDEYLKNANLVSLYPKFGEVIAVVYRKMNNAYQSRAAILKVTANDIRWYNEQKLLGKYQGPGMPPRTVRYDHALLDILKYDNFIQKYIHVTEQTDEQITCRLEYEDISP